MPLLKNLKTNSVLTNEEKIIVEKKYSSIKFKFLNDVEKVKLITNLVLKIHVITGWVLPENEIMEVFVEQFFKKVTEEYSSLNKDEFEHAFRSLGTTIEDWGKEMNLNLIDKVLRQYLETRFEISEKEEKQLPPPEIKSWTNEDILNKYRSEIEICFQALKRGYYPIIHIYFEETLSNDGMMIEEENISEFFVRKLGDGTKNLYIKE